MKQYLLLTLDWSEVWALMIPLTVLLLRREQIPSLRPVIVYLWLGFLVNIIIDIIMAINVYVHETKLSNNPFYNIHSVLRFVCFSVYFIRLQKNAFVKLKRWLAICGIGFVVINFIFFEKFFDHDSLSGNLLTFEAFLLLAYCMFYYLAELKNEDNLFNSPHFWVVTGLAIYVIVNFFVFLFYQPMLHVNGDLALNIWYVHNVAFIIFCLFITKAFYGPFGYQPAV